MRWILGALVLLALSRVIAVGRKAPETLAEQRERVFGKREPKYRRTHEANRWKLRIARSERLKRRA